jgi:hypothetical protein
MRVSGQWCAILSLLTLCGCGNREAKVTGTVTLDGSPLSGAVVSFRPAGATAGTVLTGRTAADGRYTLGATRRGATIAAGEYKVTISKLVMPDGSDFPADSPVAPIDSPARESLPPDYSDPERTTLTALVPEGGGTVDFPLKKTKGVK